MKQEKRIAAVLALFCALLALMVASTASPRYAVSFWTDTNIYFTIGRGMTHGLAPYRDLFDHKGPLLFLLYAWGAMISDTSFIGVFALEVASLACALYIGWRIVRLYGDGELTFCAVPVLAMVTVTCTAFTQGGSAEEFCLPALTLALYTMLANMRRQETDTHVLLRYGLFGASMAWTFLIKYTDCGLFFGLGLCAVCFELRRFGFFGVFRSVMAMLAGFLCVLFVPLIYLLATRTLGDCVRVYLVENLTDYSGTRMSPIGHLYNALAYLRTQSAANPVVAGLALLGVLGTSVSAWLSHRKGWLFEALCMPIGAGLMLLFCYWGEMAHPYYALIFAALCPTGLLFLSTKHLKIKQTVVCMLCASLCIAVFPVCHRLCLAVPLETVRREDMPQQIFAEIINSEETPTLLDVTSLDQGFYFAAGIIPNCRYFADNNLQTEEKKQAIADYLANARTQFVVTRWRDVGERYELVARASGVFDLNDERTYLLYRRKKDGYAN